MNLRAFFKRCFDKARIFVQELNVFSTNEDDDLHEIRNQVLSTRIYLVLLIVSVFALLIYTSIIPVTETVIVKQPTFDQYKELISKNVNPQCQCKQISISFNEFIDLQAHYHPICSSDFISNEWIDFLSSLTLLPNIYYSDFRRTAVNSFQFLRSLCELAETTINETIQLQLQSKSYISAHVKTNETFQEEIQSFLNTLIDTERMNFAQLLTIFRNLTFSQQLVSTLTTNVLFFILTSKQISVQTYRANYKLRSYYNAKIQKECECYYSSCIEEYKIQSIKSNKNVFIVPDFYTGCFIVDSLLESSLICFYNETCIDQLLFHLNSSSFNSKINLKPLSKQLRKTNQTVNELMSHLMVDEWNRTINFNKYYQLCEPLQCLYTYNHRFAIDFIVTTFLAIIGGLITVLRVLVPQFVRIIRNKRSNDNINIRLWLIEKFKSINLFQSDPPSTDNKIIRLQVISTYIYIITFFISLIILIIYTAILPQTVTATVRLPSTEQYEQLNVQYPDTLICECSQISIDLNSFIKLIPKYHQVCSSVYITDEWRRYLVSYLANRQLSNLYHILRDFRLTTGPSFFNLLESFCKITHEIMGNRLELFESTGYITKTVVNRKDFLEQQNRSIQLFKTVLRNRFLVSFQIFIEIIELNSLLTWSRTSYDIHTVQFPSLSVNIVPTIYSDDCVCFIQSERCFATTYILHAKNLGSEIVIESLWPVPDIFTGCYPYMGAVLSSLDCFYNQSCLSALIKNLQPTEKMNISLLESHLLTSKFDSDTRIGVLFGELMIEQWKENISYESYYGKCNPKQCTYTYVQRFLVSYIISAILGIIGALSLILRFIIPNLVKLGRKILIKIRNEKDEGNQDEDKTSISSGFIL